MFGITSDIALAENDKAQGGVELIPLAEWLEMVENKTAQIRGGYG